MIEAPPTAAPCTCGDMRPILDIYDGKECRLRCGKCRRTAQAYHLLDCIKSWNEKITLAIAEKQGKI